MDICLQDSEPKVTARCTQQLVPKIQNDLGILANEIQWEEVNIKQIGLEKYLATSEGQDLAEDLGRKHNTCITRKSDEQDDTMAGK